MIAASLFMLATAFAGFSVSVGVSLARIASALERLDARHAWRETEKVRP